MYGLSWLDLLMIVAYFGSMIWIGLWSTKRVKNKDDYFLAGRRFGKLVQVSAAFGQATSSDAPVSATIWVARNGVAGIWASISNVITLPVYWLNTIWYRRMRQLTMADFFEERFQSKGIAVFYSIFSSFFFIAALAIGFASMTRTINGMMIKPVEKLSAQEQVEYRMALEKEHLEQSDYASLSQADKDRLEEIRKINPRKEFSYMNDAVLTWATAIIVIFYSGLGGLEAAFLTNVLQGVLIIVLSVMLLPFLYVKIGHDFNVSGLSGILEVARSNLPQEAFELWNSPTAVDSQWYFVLAMMALMVLNVATQANQLTAVGAAKDEYASRYGFTVGIYIKRVCTLLWGVTALLVVILYGSVVSNIDFLWGYACNDLLGMAGCGMVGLMVASLMAALMSTVSTLMISGAGLFTMNVVKPLWPAMSEKQCVNIGRIAGIFIVVAAAQISLMYQQIFDLIVLTMTFNCMLAPLVWLGIKWRRANTKAAWTCIIASTILFFIIPCGLSLFDSVKTNSYLAKTTNPVVINRTYVAKKMDVEKRSRQIEQWRQLSPQQQALAACPQPLEAGQKFIATYTTPKKSIFWAQGLTVGADGRTRGAGLLNIELVLVEALGFDLSKNSYSLNMTIRFLICMLVPFIIFYVVSKCTKPLDKTILDRFFVKMKTPAFGSHEEDAREMELSYQNPQRFDYKKMFPNTDWEFEKFDKTDIKGIVISTLGGLLLIAALWFVAILGKQ